MKVCKSAFFWLLLIAGSLFSQEQFVQFTCYDQLTWSDDGNQLAFRCVLLDESQPEQAKTNILIKTLNEEQLLCLDPQPERFIISKDKKYLLFSGSYGLYLVSLEENNRAAQLYFRNPAATWVFQDFGFLKDRSTIYLDRYESTSMKTVSETFRIQAPEFSTQFIDRAEVKPVKTISRSSRFDLSVDEMKERLQTEIKVNNIMVKFLSQPDAVDPGNFKLIYQPSRKSPFHAILMERCRPRLLSVNPDSTEIIASVFQQGEHRTYRIPFSSRQLIAIENKRYFSVSWLDAKKYICLTEDGLFLRDLDLSLNKKIDQWQVPEWCREIDRDLPQFELQVGFEAERDRAEQRLAQLKELGYHARMKYFEDQTRSGYRIRVGGFRTREQARATGEKLKSRGFDFWVDKIADAYDFFNSTRADEQTSFGDRTASVEYRKDHFLRSRIVLIDSDKSRSILVDEMNNIPGREKW